MALNRAQVVALLPRYINSFSAENKMLGDEKILAEIKTNFERLTHGDQEFVRTKFKALEEAAFPKKKKAEFAAEYKNDLAQGAAMGAVVAALPAGFCLSKGLFGKAVKYLGASSLAGALAYPVLKDPKKAQNTIDSMRPYVRLKAALGLAGVLAHLCNGVAPLSEEAQQQLGMRQRHGR